MPQHNIGNLSVQNLNTLAGQIGLDGSSFGACLDSHRYAAWVSQETQRGQQRGVQGTPALFIKDRMLRPLPRSFDELRTVIQQARDNTATPAPNPVPTLARSGA